jgi:hypothetical protein
LDEVNNEYNANPHSVIEHMYSWSNLFLWFFLTIIITFCFFSMLRLFYKKI